MGAGSAKGVSTANEDDDADVENDRFSVISNDSPKLPKSSIPKPQTNNNNNNAEARTSNIRAKMEALSAESEDEDSGAKSTEDPEKKEDEKKRGLFGFSKKEEDKKTNAFVHEEEKDQKDGKKSSSSSKGFRFFKFKKEEKKKSEEKDEKLDQEINDLQRTFDSLGIVGKGLWDEDPKKNAGKPKKSQSADDIRDLEPMRNRMNQKRRFSNNRTGNGNSFRRGTDGLQTSSGGSRRTFKYSWETEHTAPVPVQTEDWKYEAVTIEGFDLEKFKRANIEGSSLNSRLPNSIGADSPPVSPANGVKSSPLTYDPMEQRLLATIERDF